MKRIREPTTASPSTTTIITSTLSLLLVLLTTTPSTTHASIATNDDNNGNTVGSGIIDRSWIGSSSNSNNNGSGCRVVMEKNEWAAGCIPAVNFVVKLVDCGEGVAMSDITVRFIDENDKELGRDYFVTPPGQCTVTGYGNIKTITPRGGNQVYMVANCDLCGGKNGGGGTASSVPSSIAGQVTDCF